MVQIYKKNSKFIKSNMQSCNVAFILNDDYIKYLSVTLSQLKKHCSKDLTIILLYDELSEKNIRKISKYCLRKKFEIIFVDISNYNLIDLNDGRSEYWFSSMAKKILLTTDFFSSIAPILYLDIDISIVGSIDELFNLDKKPMYGVIELASMTRKASEFIIPKKIIPENIVKTLGDNINLKKYFEYIDVNDYINAGVLIINPNLCKTILPFKEVLNYVYSDQDFININFNSTKEIIEYKWNVSASFLYSYNKLNTIENFMTHEQYYLFQKSLLDKRIIHYAGYIKPWERFFIRYEKWDYDWFFSMFKTNFKWQLLWDFFKAQNRIIFKRLTL